MRKNVLFVFVVVFGLLLSQQLFAQSFDTAGNASQNPRVNVYLYYERYYMPLVTR